MKIAFLGTGLMGGPMAKNLAVSGFHISAWNRTPSKAVFLKEFEVMFNFLRIWGFLLFC